MARHDPGLYGRSFADVYDDWYTGLDDAARIARSLATRCRAGATIVEFGIGTGRLASPLCAAGFQVIGIDSSMPMLRRCPTGPLLVAGDMTAVGLASNRADAVLIAYNTLFNVASRALQATCLHEAARLVRADGLLAIESFIAPTFEGEATEMTIRPHHSRADGRVAIITKQVVDDAGRHMVGAHIEILPEATHTRPWQLTYLDPEELDAAAAAAGLVLIERTADWAGAPFDPGGDRHVSWYRPLR